jgi:hypothetical protein
MVGPRDVAGVDARRDEGYEDHEGGFPNQVNAPMRTKASRAASRPKTECAIRESWRRFDSPAGTARLLRLSYRGSRYCIAEKLQPGR